MSELTDDQRDYIMSRRWTGRTGKPVHIFGAGSRYVTIKYLETCEFVPINKFKRRFQVVKP